MGIGPVIIRNWHGFAWPATGLGDMLGFMLYVLGTNMGHIMGMGMEKSMVTECTRARQR